MASTIVPCRHRPRCPRPHLAVAGDVRRAVRTTARRTCAAPRPSSCRCVPFTCQPLSSRRPSNVAVVPATFRPLPLNVVTPVSVCISAAIAASMDAGRSAACRSAARRRSRNAARRSPATSHTSARSVSLPAGSGSVAARALQCHAGLFVGEQVEARAGAVHGNAVHAQLADFEHDRVDRVRRGRECDNKSRAAPGFAHRGRRLDCMGADCIARPEPCPPDGVWSRFEQRKPGAQLRNFRDLATNPSCVRHGAALCPHRDCVPHGYPWLTAGTIRRRRIPALPPAQPRRREHGHPRVLQDREPAR